VTGDRATRRAVTRHAAAFAASAWRTGRLAVRGDLRTAPEHVGHWLTFTDGTRSQVYRETVRSHAATRDPALLVVAFELPLVGTRAFFHTLFRPVSMVNTPLFAGFPGFRSKLWLTDLRTGVYRGVYQWDGPQRADEYAVTLTALLRPLCRRGSVSYHVHPEVWRDEFLRQPAVAGASPGPGDRWWMLREAMT